MRTYQKIAQSDEQELLAKLLPMRILRAKQRQFWTINTPGMTYELVGLGRLPPGLSITEEWSNPTEMNECMLQDNDLFECYDKQTEVGKYKITTKCFTGGTEKFNHIHVDWNNVLQLSRMNCIRMENLGVTTQVITKKKTYMSTEESTKSTTARLYYKFHFM